MDSQKYLNSVVGHEVTHVLEGTKFYEEFQKAAFEFAKNKGEYKDRLSAAWDLYKDVDGYKGPEGFKKIKREVVADLAGDYLFTDPDFIKNLSVNHRNIFQYLYDEIKYLCKVATAGSKEARELERVKKAFEDAYRASPKGVNETKLSISKTSKMEYGVQLKQIEDGKLNGSNSLYIGTSVNLQNAGLSDAPYAMNQGDYRKSRRETANNKNYSSHSVPYDFFENLPDHLNNAPMLIDNGEKVTIVTSYPMGDTKGNDSYVIVGVWKDQTMESDTVNLIKSVYPWDDFAERITKSAEKGNLVVTNKNKVEQMLTTIGIQPAEVSRILNLVKDSIPQKGKNVNPLFSLSKDSQGRSLSAEQQKRFGNLAISGEDVLYSSHERIVNKLTGEEVDGKTYSVLDRLNNGEGVSLDEIANLKEVREGKERQTDLVHQLVADHPELANIPLDDVGTYLLNGEERTRLRENIISQRLQEGSFSGVDKNGKEVYNGSVRKDRRLDIVIGLPASGKSSAVVNPLSEQHQSQVIDSDIIKAMLPEYQDGWGTSLVHEESSQLNFQLLKESMRLGNNVVLPVVGSKVSSIETYIAIAKEQGYIINLHLNELPNGKAVGRMLRRYFNTGRFIDPTYTANYGNKPTEVYETFKQRSDINGYSRWNNDVEYGQNAILTEDSGIRFLVSQGDGESGKGRGRVPGQLAKGTESGEASQQINNDIAPIKESSNDGSFFDSQTPEAEKTESGWTIRKNVWMSWAMRRFLSILIFML